MKRITGSRTHGVHAAALFVSVAMTSCIAGAASPPAIGYVNGHVYTDSGWTTGLAISSDKIVSVGDAASVRASLPEHATVIDLKGRTVLPGLFDMHTHPIAAAKALHACKFAPESGLDEIIAVVANCAKNTSPGAWIYGDAWPNDAPYLKKFNKSLLDKVAPNNPVLLMDTTGHNGLANSKALAAGGFTKGSTEPTNGRIIRDADGEPTGLLYESPANKLRYRMPTANAEEACDLLALALGVFASNGITSITDASVKLDEVRGYHALAAANRLKIQVRGCIQWGPDAPDFDSIYRDRRAYEARRFRLDCIKVFMDGVPNESRSAAMIEPYTPVRGSNAPPTRGELTTEPTRLNAKVTEWDRAGMIVKFHAGGDLGQKDALDAIEAARRTNGMRGPQHEVSHNSFATVINLKRAKPLNAVLEFSPVFWYSSPLAENILAAVGLERGVRAWPAREAIDDGALVFGASDWPAVESPSPWIAIETLVTRKAPGGTGSPFAPQESITLQEAINMYTIWPAQAFGRPGDDGTIHVGAPADLVIIDRNPFDIPITEVHNIKTLRTISDGEIIFDNGEIDGKTPSL